MKKDCTASSETNGIWQPCGKSWQMRSIAETFCFKKYIVKTILQKENATTPGNFHSILSRMIIRRWLPDRSLWRFKTNWNAEQKKKHSRLVRKAVLPGKSDAHAAERIIAERQHLITSSGAVRPTTPKERNAARTQRSSQRKRWNGRRLKFWKWTDFRTMHFKCRFAR